MSELEHVDFGALTSTPAGPVPKGWRPGYIGSKGQDGVWQRIIGQMPPHSVYVEAFAGSAAIFFHKRPAAASVLIDASAAVVADLAASIPASGAGVVIHDWRFAGRNFRERLALKRLAARWRARVQAMPARKRGYVLDSLRLDPRAETGAAGPQRQRDRVAPAPALGDRETVLSIFPGADLLGRAFEAEGFCVVRGPDLVWGGDVRDFHPPRGVFQGVIGGSPCQEFSGLNRKARNPGQAGPSGYGVEMVRQFARCVAAAAPEWFLMENVPGVPSVTVPGYTVQRFNLAASECGCRQRRLRTFQFGSRDGLRLVLARRDTVTELVPTATATEARRAGRRTFADFCELQGLPRSFDLPGLSLAAKYRAVGNGVPIPMGRVVAIAVLRRLVTRGVKVCACDCGRPVTALRTLATAACRKRMQRRRDAAGVTKPGPDTSGASQKKPGEGDSPGDP